MRCRKLGLDVPCPYFVDMEKRRIYMEYIDGQLVKNLLQGNKISSSQLDELSEKIGNYLAILHDGDLIHGDLTTSNMMIRKGSGNLVSRLRSCEIYPSIDGISPTLI
jgi:Kae1-associated kinase Bud32